MKKQINPVQEYIEELNKIKIPSNEDDILDFLGSLDSKLQKKYLSFILSQSHIFTAMETIINTYTHRNFYSNAGYSDKTGNIVPKLDENNRVYYEEYTSSESTYKACRTILKSLQGNDKTVWEHFVNYVKSIYEPTKMDIYFDPQLVQFSQDIMIDFRLLTSEMIRNDSLRDEINELNNKPAVKENSFVNKIKGFFFERKKEKEIRKKEALLQEDSKFYEQAISLIKKYKENKNVSSIMKSQLEFAERLINAGVPKDVFIRILDGISRCAEASSMCNYRIFNMLKQLSINATIAKEIYSPEILYAESFQDMTKKIRLLLSKNDLKEDVPITTEYREKPLGNALLAREDISNILKGKNLSQKEIQSKMVEYDEEFKRILEEENAEIYIRRCTDLMMKFVSTHPFDDGNGRTSRMLLQAMLARRGIFFPSNIDNYFERQSGTDYCEIEKRGLRTEDYTEMENYIIERAKEFNNGELVLNDNPLFFNDEEEQKVVEQEKG